jgi:hypothetical protein
MLKFGKKGISVVELSVAVAATALVSAAVVSINFNLKKSEKRIAVINNILEKKRYFDTVLSNERSFINTVKNIQNINMGCLRSLGTCDVSHVSNEYRPGLDRIVLSDSHGNVIYDGRETNTKGFTEGGAECLGFDYNGPGNDNCPIGYIVSWHIAKAQLDSGNNITITAKTVYNPSDSNSLKPVIRALLQSSNVTPYDSSLTISLAPSPPSAPPPNCIEGSVTLFNGGVHTFYESPSVNLGSECKSQTRLCTIVNNTPNLSGSYTYETCRQDCHGEWTSCSAACGGGTQTFRKFVNNNAFGVDCPFPDGQTRNCNEQPCVAHVDCQGSWGACSVSCGGGTQNFTITTPPANGGAACPASPQSCNTQSCSLPIDCQGYWSSCSKPCGGGTEIFTVTTSPANGGLACPSSPRPCNTESCSQPTDCEGVWSACSAACGGGSQSFTITTPAANGGVACPSSPRSCNTQACDVDCAGSWGECSATCDGGKQSFKIKQSPSGNGAVCPASPRDCNTQDCALKPPAVDCQGYWEPCNPTCGEGTQNFVITTAASNGGAECPTSPRACNSGACPVDCQGSWGACSEPCGGGTETFNVTVPASGGGASCPASPRPCNTQACNPPGCTIRHPISWDGGNRFNQVVCVEYFLSIGGQYTKTFVPEGELETVSAGYCPYQGCWGQYTYRCEKGKMVPVTKICNSGKEP